MLAREIADFTAGLLGLIAPSAAVAVRVEVAASRRAITFRVQRVLMDVVDCGILISSSHAK